MLKKYLIFFLLMNILQGCGFTPIYSSNNNVSFHVKEINIEGDWETNILIKNSILKGSSSSSKNSYKLDITTNYLKNSITKNSKGNATSYEIILETNFTVISDNSEKTFLIKEKFIMEDFTDKLEEKRFEKIVKENLANIIVNKFKIKLNQGI